MLPEAFLQHCSHILRAPVARARPLPGGDIHRTFLLTGTSGQTWFLKCNTRPEAAAMFRTEAVGLALLGASRNIATPRVLGEGQWNEWVYLLLEYIVPGYKNRLFWENFGASLANLHGNTAAQYGFSHDNFIGSLPQSNSRHDTWAAFYAAERLLPQMQLARQNGLLDSSDERRLQGLCKKLASVCPEEQPCLIHGDLWSGNFLCNALGLPVLIDPSCAFAHREMDLAMSLLFGGFDPVFYSSYEATWPLDPGFDKRAGIYQLYYLLVHVNLFGGGYVGQTRGVLSKYI